MPQKGLQREVKTTHAYSTFQSQSWLWHFLVCLLSHVAVYYGVSQGQSTPVVWSDMGNAFPCVAGGRPPARSVG